MSTKAIRKALERLATLEDGSGPETLRALAEVQRIEKLAKIFTANGIAHPLLDAIAQDAP